MWVLETRRGNREKQSDCSRHGPETPSMHSCPPAPLSLHVLSRASLGPAWLSPVIKDSAARGLGSKAHPHSGGDRGDQKSRLQKLKLSTAV